MRPLLLDKEHGDCTGKNNRSTAKGGICRLAAYIPLHVGLAEQIDTHQRNAKGDRLCPYLENLQYCQNNNGQRNNDGEYGNYCLS